LTDAAKDEVQECKEKPVSEWSISVSGIHPLLFIIFSFLSSVCDNYVI